MNTAVGDRELAEDAASGSPPVKSTAGAAIRTWGRRIP